MYRKKIVTCDTGATPSATITCVLGKIKGENNEVIISRGGKIKII